MFFSALKLTNDALAFETVNQVNIMPRVKENHYLKALCTHLRVLQLPVIIDNGFRGVTAKQELNNLTSKLKTLVTKGGRYKMLSRSLDQVYLLTVRCHEW